MKQVTLALVLLFATGFSVASEQAYVSDQLEIQFRSGPSIQNKILRMLKSGTPVEVLEVQESTGYSYVALASGEEGWILSRYLTRHPIASSLLEASSSKMTETLDSNKNLKAENQGLKIERDSLDKSAKELHEEVSRLSSELTTIRQASASVIQIQNDRDSLQKKNIELENKLQTLQREKQALDSSTQQNWFMIGSGVLGGGILLGILLPRLSFRRKNNWNRF
jgi:SH3 domain protein